MLQISLQFLYSQVPQIKCLIFVISRVVLNKLLLCARGKLVVVTFGNLVERICVINMGHMTFAKLLLTNLKTIVKKGSKNPGAVNQ